MSESKWFILPYDKLISRYQRYGFSRLPETEENDLQIYVFVIEMAETKREPLTGSLLFYGTIYSLGYPMSLNTSIMNSAPSLKPLLKAFSIINTLTSKVPLHNE